MIEAKANFWNNLWNEVEVEFSKAIKELYKPIQTKNIKRLKSKRKRKRLHNQLKWKRFRTS